jgi:hypothetical protein
VNGTVQFTAVAKNADGDVLAVKPTWSIVSGGGTISSTGLFTAGTTPGTTVIAVTCSGLTVNATITVTAGPLATITVAPDTTLIVGATAQFRAVGRDALGNVVAITPVWSVINPVAGTPAGTIIATTGLFTAGNTIGTFPNSVQACVGTICDQANVIVIIGPLFAITVAPDTTLAVGATAQFRAVGRDAGGNVVAITPVWSVINPVAGTPAGTIIPTTGLFTAGTTTGSFPNSVQACVGTICDQANVIVIAVLATITVTPNPATMPINTTQQFAAIGRDGNGNPFPISPVWSVVNGGGSIDSVTGLFTAGGVTGTFTNTVKATSGAIFGTATVIVTAAPPPTPIVDLGTTELTGILAGSTVTCITGGVVNADIDIYAGSALVGFGPCVLTGAKHLADAVAQQAQADLLVAYNTLVGLPCGTVIGTADIGGTTKAAGVYCSASTIGVTGNLTLDGGGDPNATFVFQAGSSLTGVGNIILINGAQAENVFWVNGAAATIGVGSAWQGNILAVSSITLNDNVTLLGRALTRIGAVTLGNNNVITLP